MEIKNSIVIITGASSGIGLATAKLLSAQGAKVGLVARSKDKLEKIAQELPDSMVIQTDMSNETDITAMVKNVKEHFGRVDILINNAGQGYDASVETMHIDMYRKIFDLNLVGPIVAMQQVIPIMRQQNKGVIVNITSGTALMHLPTMSPYSSLKRALVGISLTAREELKNDHISVSLVYPYITLTDFEKNTLKDKPAQSEPARNDEDLFQPPDKAEYVAGKILEVIESEEAEIYAHDWMKNLQ